jgi:aryl-alcohol dehydrogenase-like predicted oxidoreductase
MLRVYLGCISFCFFCVFLDRRSLGEVCLRLLAHQRCTAWIDAGINILDTASVHSRGRSEEFTGEAVKRNRRRQQIFLCTKVHGSMDDVDPNQQGNSRRHIIEQCEASLRRLQTDYLDLYQIHRPHPETAIDETLRALDDLIRSGKVRYIGATTFAGWQVVEALWVSKELGLNRFVSE